MYTTANIQAKTTLAATFMSRDAALDAADRLKELGYADIWIGLAKHDSTAEHGAYSEVAGSQTRVEAENWFQRWFGEGDESLHDALVQRGVAEADIRNVAAARSFVAVLTVDGTSDPDQTATVLRQAQGRIINSGYSAVEIAPVDPVNPPSVRGEGASTWRETVFVQRRPVANDAPPDSIA